MVYMYVHGYVCRHIYADMCICAYVGICLYVCMYICIAYADCCLSIDIVHHIGSIMHTVYAEI